MAEADRGNCEFCKMPCQLEEDVMRLTLAALLLVGFSLPAVSQATTSAVLITKIMTGRDSESFAIVTQEPILNPQHCPTPDGYVSDSSQAGYNTYYAAALAAYVSNTPVLITIFDRVIQPATRRGAGVVVPSPCDRGRPRLIGIDLTRSGR